MERDFLEELNTLELETPVFIVSEEAIRRNCEILESVRSRTGCKILLALKAFSMYSMFPLMRPYLSGVCASSPYEARLGREEFGLEVHSYAAAFSRKDFDSLLAVSDHIVFNSLSQYNLFREDVLANQKVSFGFRVNPGYSEAPSELYDPGAPGSRLGMKRELLGDTLPEGISGLHFHVLCEQNSDALLRTVNVFEERFASLLHDISWLNFGGGHHITRADYDINLLCDIVSRFMDKYGCMVYLEPGEAAALNAGVLVATVLDIVRNDIDIAILDASAAAHVADVIEMPFRPNVVSAAEPGELPHTYRLAGLSCLAGDVFGDYSFAEPLRVGDRVYFLDMAHYTMVKTTTFNGLQLPSIAKYGRESGLSIIRQFEYEDFKSRL